MAGLNHRRGLGVGEEVAAGAGQGGEVVDAEDPGRDPGLQERGEESDPGLVTGGAEAGQEEEERRGRGQDQRGGMSPEAGAGAGVQRRSDQEAGAPRRRSRGKNQWRKGENPSPGIPQGRNQSPARSFSASLII